MQFKGKLMDQTCKNGEKTNIGPVFTWVLPLLDVIHCCKLSSYAISRKKYDLNTKMVKKLILSLI